MVVHFFYLHQVSEHMVPKDSMMQSSFNFQLFKVQVEVQKWQFGICVKHVAFVLGIQKKASWFVNNKTKILFASLFR